MRLRNRPLASAETVGLAAFLVLMLSGIAGAQPGSGSINGTIKSSQGAVIGGAPITYGRLKMTVKGSMAMAPPVSATLSDAKGDFAAGNLAAGTYLFCVQPPPGTMYLDPCHWSKTPPTFTINGAQAIHGATI